MERITIIGLGLIGGSIGLALKRSQLKELQIVGVARSRETVQRAKKIGAIDEEMRDPAEAVVGAKLVIVAAPILATPQIFRDIAPALEPGTIVTDAASTKGNVMAWARELLPEHVQFVGGHPMAGKETSGIDSADADLFRDKTWVIVPAVGASEGAVRTVVGVAQELGASPTYMDADEHDSYVAAVSHLPLALSSVLFSMVFQSAAWPEMAKLASSGFRDATRLASGSPEMAHDIMHSNRDNVLHWLDRFQDELYRLRATIAAGDSEPLLEAFARPQIERDNYMLNGAPRRDVSAPIENVSLGDILLGSKINSFMKKQQNMIKDMEANEKGKRR